MNAPMVLSEPEASYFRRFFEAVDNGVTQEMQAGASLLEDSLTFVLARLLDGTSTFQRVLEYPLDRLNADLQACGSGTAVTIEFETNEHKKSFEAAVSHADLGIVIRWEGSALHAEHTKALIVQSKKLYHSKGRYGIRSEYGGFDAGQFTNLKKIADSYGSDGVFYFLYNPAMGAFAEDEANVLRAIEARLYSAVGWPYGALPFWHPEIEFIFHRFFRRHPFGTSCSALPPDSALPDRLRDERNKALQWRPGLRVLGISSVEKIAAPGKSVRKSFRLEECYRYAFSDHWWQCSGTVPFLPLSSFIVDLVLGCARGSDNESIVRIAEGREPQPTSDDDSDNQPPGLAVRHTLRITVRNTLPQMDVHFHE